MTIFDRMGYEAQTQSWIKHLVTQIANESNVDETTVSDFFVECYAIVSADRKGSK
jgi:hypothetical protein